MEIHRADFTSTSNNRSHWELWALSGEIATKHSVNKVTMQIVQCFVCSFVDYIR